MSELDAETESHEPRSLNQPQWKEMQWKEMQTFTNDNLAAARKILKDAGSVTRWSRVLTEKASDRQQQSQEIRPEGQRRKEEQHGEQHGEQREADAGDAKPLTVEAKPLTVSAGRFFPEGVGNQTIVIRLQGDLDLFTSPQVLALLLSLARDRAATQDNPVVVLDLRVLGFIDLSGFQVLIQGQKALVSYGLRLIVLLRPDSQPERTFLRISLSKIIRHIHSLEEL